MAYMPKWWALSNPHNKKSRAFRPLPGSGDNLWQESWRVYMDRLGTGTGRHKVVQKQHWRLPSGDIPKYDNPHPGLGSNSKFFHCGYVVVTNGNNIENVSTTSPSVLPRHKDESMPRWETFCGADPEEAHRRRRHHRCRTRVYVESSG
jgi:hypothetical protein